MERCIYCEEPPVETVRTIDGKDEAVCTRHVRMYDVTGLADYLPIPRIPTADDVDLAEYIREKVIKPNEV